MKSNKRLDLLAFKMDSFDTNSFIRDALAYSKNSVLCFFNLERVFYLVHKPRHIKWAPSPIKLPVDMNQQLYRFALPVFVLYVVFFVWMMRFGYLCVRFRPLVCWTDNSWVAMVFGIARKLGFCECSIFYSGDWVDSPKKNIASYVLNNILFRGADYVAATLNDMVMSITREISEARDRFWGRKVAKRVVVTFPPPLMFNKRGNNNTCLKICFIGQVRGDSGLELLLPLLPRLNQKHGIILKIVGPKTAHREEIERQIETLGVSRFVELHGWVETEKMGAVAEDCFCGINLLTNKNSHSSYTTPGKLFHYLQNMLPLLITEGNGPFTEYVRSNGLGVVTEPVSDQIAGAIELLFTHQAGYRENIRSYAIAYPGKTLSNYIEIAKQRF